LAFGQKLLFSSNLAIITPNLAFCGAVASEQA